MNIQRAITFMSTAAIAVAMLCSCTMPVRTGYDRRIGGYKPVPQAVSDEPEEEQQNEQVSSDTSSNKGTDSTVAASPSSRTTAGNAKAAAKQKSKPQPPKNKGSLEKYARGWIGAKYVYGAATKKKTDCSGFVMQVYKGYYNIALDHSASKMYKDPRGKKISRGSLKEGDLIFFGSFWSIDHVGIYLSGDRFIHASTSKGVIISPMSDKYWHGKYQGARRFK